MREKNELEEKEDNVIEFPTPEKTVDEDYKESVEAGKAKRLVVDINIEDGSWICNPEGDWNIDQLCNVSKGVFEVYNTERLASIVTSNVLCELVNTSRERAKEDDKDGGIVTLN